MVFIYRRIINPKIANITGIDNRCIAISHLQSTQSNTVLNILNHTYTPLVYFKLTKNERELSSYNLKVGYIL